MRIRAIGLSAVLLALSLTTSSKACEDYVSAAVLAANDDAQTAFAQATNADAVKKPAKKKKMTMKKKPKVEYMRAVPMGPAGK